MTTANPHRSWRQRLLPLMAWLLVGLTIFFFLTTLRQLVRYEGAILETSPFQNPDIEYLVSPLDTAPPEQVKDISRLRALIILEAIHLERHYRHGNLLLLTRVWTHYLGFSTGMILALVGASFILGRLEFSSTQLGATAPGIELKLRTLSPGLVLACLGTFLMALTIIVHHGIEMRENPVYLRDQVYDEMYTLPLKEGIPNLPRPPLRLPRQADEVPANSNATDNERDRGERK